MSPYFCLCDGWLQKIFFWIIVIVLIASGGAMADQPTIRIIEEPEVSQPPPFSRGGTTVVVPRTRIIIGGESSKKRRRDVARRVTLVGIPTIIDGDTIRIAGRVVHLYGIDAPESAQKCRYVGAAYPCGAMATAHLAHLTLGRKVNCKGEDKLPTGELLGHCRMGKHDLGDVMVGSGWALAYRKESDQFADAEEHAKREKLGLWRGEFVRPWVWRIKH